MELREKIDLVRKIAAPASGVAKKTLLSLKVGSVLRLKGETSPLFMVDDIFDYTETNKHGDKKSFTWKEYSLVNLEDFTTRFLEIEDDDGLHAYLTGEKVPQGKLSEIPSAKTKSLRIGGKHDEFYLDEVCHAAFSNKNGDEQVLMLDYETDSGILLGVEVWESGNCEAFIYSEVKTKDIEVIAHD